MAEKDKQKKEKPKPPVTQGTKIYQGYLPDKGQVGIADARRRRPG